MAAFASLIWTIASGSIAFLPQTVSQASSPNSPSSKMVDGNPNATDEMTTTWKPDPLARAVFLWILIACGILCFAMILSAITCFFFSSRDHKRYNTPRPDLMVLLNDKTHAMDSSTIREESRKVIALIPATTVEGIVRTEHDQKQIDEFLTGIVDKNFENQEKAQGKIEFARGTRDDGTLGIRKETRVTVAGSTEQNTHVSKLADFYNNPLYLAEAPYPNGFDEHWKLIWQEKIGVIVWVGRLQTDNRHSMDSYIEEVEGDRVQHGEFSITTKKTTFRTSRFTIYCLLVTHGDKKRAKAREITLIHAYEWLQDSISWALRRDVLTILTVKQEHCRHITKGSPGVMFQCKFGTAGSAAMCSVYIGYQMWMRCRRVNVYGVLKYVRRCRWGAYEITGDPSHTFLLQVQVVYTVMSGMARFGSTGFVPRCETWIRTIWGVERESIRNE